MLAVVCPKLPMRNISATKDFYINKLNFEIVGEYDDYLIVEKDAIELHFFKFEQLDIRENYAQVYVRVVGIDKWYQALLSNNVTIHPNGKLEKKPWGQKEFSLIDNDNNLPTFGEDCN